MTTYDLSSRFSAQDAADFCEYIVASSTAEQLQQAPPKTNPKFYESGLKVPWELLDPTFVSTWSYYRIPTLRVQTRALRWMASFRLGKTFIELIRRWYSPNLNIRHSLECSVVP